MTKDINDLLPIVKQKCLDFQAKAKAQGIEFIVTSVYRSKEEQDMLYLHPFNGIDDDGDGKIDEPDEKITNARGGQSFHNWRCAFDIVPVIQGKAIWNNNDLWNRLGKIGMSCGLEWGGSWTGGFVDIPHFQYTAGYTFNDFINNKEISESWIEAAFVPFNSVRHSNLTLQYLEKALGELPNHKKNRKIFFVNGWLGAFIGGQKSEEALNIVNKFLADNPNLDKDLRLKILENVDVIERAVKIRQKFGK